MSSRPSRDLNVVVSCTPVSFFWQVRPQADLVEVSNPGLTNLATTNGSEGLCGPIWRYSLSIV